MQARRNNSDEVRVLHGWIETNSFVQRVRKAVKQSVDTLL
ncbi:unnamed protein product [Urochloa humidicola]